MNLQRNLLFLLTVFCLHSIGLCEREKEAKWTGQVFPLDDGANNVEENDGSNQSSSPNTRPWKGKWFPQEPKKTDKVVVPHSKKSKRPQLPQMGVADSICDDGKTNLGTDFDPFDISQHEVMLCTRPYKRYFPNVTVKAHHREYKIPAGLEFKHICMNETITYPYDIPTFGDHRLLWAQWGEYGYLPPQRWIHNLEHGGIVLLYHPCTLSSEVERLKKIVSECMYRHIITPYAELSEERPIALLSWGHSLEMSVVSKTLAINFIRQHSLHGKENLFEQGQYNAMLKTNATIISDVHDSKLCPYYFMYNSTNTNLV